MEFLDSLDLDTFNKKSHRVRSWYLYEQFKSLERSQLDAAQKLKDRSYQERILHQELSERRARRKLYDQFGLCQSESRLKIRGKSAGNYVQRTTVSTSNDDFLESFYLLQEDERVTQVTGANEFAGEGEGDTFSQDGISASQCCLANYVTIEDQNKEDNGSCVGSITSVVENLKRDEFIPPKEMEFVQDSIDEEINSIHADMENSLAEDINMQFDSVQDDIMCLENFAKFEDIDKISEEHSFTNTAVRELNNVQVSKKADQECHAIAIWSRLVSFAYQVVQLNHGNCYCDYSSQFLTAVLACDVLRRGVNRMCEFVNYRCNSCWVVEKLGWSSSMSKHSLSEWSWLRRRSTRRDVQWVDVLPEDYSFSDVLPFLSVGDVASTSTLDYGGLSSFLDQPYVSPIKFSESDESSASPSLNVKRKKSVQLRKYRKICEIKPLSRKPKKHIKTRLLERKCSGRHCSHNDWKPYCTQSLANGTDTTARNRSATEPWCEYAEIYHYREEKSPRSFSSGTWSDLMKERPKVSRRKCKYRDRALNPMLKIAHCIDSLLKDIDDPTHDI